MGRLRFHDDVRQKPKTSDRERPRARSRRAARGGSRRVAHVRVGGVGAFLRLGASSFSMSCLARTSAGRPASPPRTGRGSERGPGAVPSPSSEPCPVELCG